MRYKRRRFWILKQKHIRIILISVCAVILLAVLYVILSSAGKKAETSDSVNAVLSKGIINIGLRSDLGPLSSFNEQTSEFEGYEKDIADEIVNRVFKDDIIVNFVEVTSKTKNAMLRRSDIDIALTASAATNISGVNYTSSYYSDASAILVINDTLGSVLDIDGGTVAIVYGTPQAQETEGITKVEEYFNTLNVNVQIKIYASYPEAVAALRNGFADGVCAGENMLKLFGIRGMKILPEFFMPNQYSVEVTENLGAFYRAVNDAINAMKTDGTLDELMVKWKLTNYALIEN